MWSYDDEENEGNDEDDEDEEYITDAEMRKMKINKMVDKTMTEMMTIKMKKLKRKMMMMKMLKMKIIMKLIRTEKMKMMEKIIKKKAKMMEVNCPGRRASICSICRHVDLSVTAP